MKKRGPIYKKNLSEAFAYHGIESVDVLSEKKYVTYRGIRNLDIPMEVKLTAILDRLSNIQLHNYQINLATRALPFLEYETHKECVDLINRKKQWLNGAAHNDRHGELRIPDMRISNDWDYIFRTIDLSKMNYILGEKYKTENESIIISAAKQHAAANVVLWSVCPYHSSERQASFKNTSVSHSKSWTTEVARKSALLWSIEYESLKFVYKKIINKKYVFELDLAISYAESGADELRL
jgi:hypothetical protein